VRVAAPRCQEIVITGDSLRAPDGGMKLFPVPISTPGFDAAPYLTATLCITKDPESGIQNIGTYRAALKATDRLVVRMVARAGGPAAFCIGRNTRRAESRCPSPS
jgi:4-hydroxy-3-polyprenylbenzoate decarboxylase